MSARPDKHCPHCNADLVGKELPPEEFLWIEDPAQRAERKAYAAANGPYYERFEIGHEIPGIYDGVLFWSCPFCGGTWHRFEPSDGRRYERAAEYIHGPVEDRPPTAQ